MTAWNRTFNTDKIENQQILSKPVEGDDRLTTMGSSRRTSSDRSVRLRDDAFVVNLLRDGPLTTALPSGSLR
jgi:hypothetical protein